MRGRCSVYSATMLLLVKPPMAIKLARAINPGNTVPLLRIMKVTRSSPVSFGLSSKNCFNMPREPLSQDQGRHRSTPTTDWRPAFVDADHLFFSDNCHFDMLTHFDIYVKITKRIFTLSVIRKPP